MLGKIDEMIGSERGQRDERTWLYLTLVPLDTHAHFIRHQPDVFSKTFLVNDFLVIFTKIPTYQSCSIWSSGSHQHL